MLPRVQLWALSLPLKSPETEKALTAGFSLFCEWSHVNYQPSPLEGSPTPWCQCISCCGHVWALCSWAISRQQEMNQHAVLYISLIFYPVEILLTNCSFHFFSTSRRSGGKPEFFKVSCLDIISCGGSQIAADWTTIELCEVVAAFFQCLSTKGMLLPGFSFIFSMPLLFFFCKLTLLWVQYLVDIYMSICCLFEVIPFPCRCFRWNPIV